MAAIANLPIGWVFEVPRRHRDDLILRATGLDGTRSRCQAARPRMLDGRWRSSWLHSGAGRLIRWPGAVTEDAMGRLRGVALLSSGP